MARIRLRLRSDFNSPVTPAWLIPGKCYDVETISTISPDIVLRVFDPASDASTEVAAGAFTKDPPCA